MPAPMCYNHAVGALARSDALAEAYRSGHNEAVLKTVWVQAHGGSNPSASAIAERTGSARPFCYGGGGEKGGGPGAAKRQRERNDCIWIFIGVQKLSAARVRRRTKRAAFARTTPKRNMFFYPHSPFSQSSPYGEYPITFILLFAARGRTRKRDATLFARRFRLHYIQKGMHSSIRTFRFRSPLLMANIPLHSSFFCLRRADAPEKETPLYSRAAFD